MQLSVLLDRSRPESLTSQMVDQIREAIRCARIGPGTRLPSSRRLSEQLAISRNTVVRAYDLLLMEGVLQSRPASGIYVAAQLPGSAPPAPSSLSAQEQPLRSRMPMPLRQAREQSASPAAANRLLYDFLPGRPSADLFPLKTWRRLLQRNLSQGGGTGLTQYGEPAGLPALRTAIANHLAAARGIMADPSRILIVSGVQEGLNLAARLFLSRGMLGVVEDPGYQGAALAFEAAGAEITGVAVDPFGLIPDQLPQQAASLLYTTPSHQYPTGAANNCPLTWCLPRPPACTCVFRNGRPPKATMSSLFSTMVSHVEWPPIRPSVLPITCGRMISPAAQEYVWVDAVYPSNVFKNRCS
jgi:GntR family transcriptional regulator / MocR family aminotransferase